MPRRRRSTEDAASFGGMGLAVIELRESRQLSKAELAKTAGIGPSTLREIEKGNRNSRWGTLRGLASALDIPLAAMIKKAEEGATGIDRRARRKQPTKAGK